MDDVTSRLTSSAEELATAIVQRMFQADRSRGAALAADLARYVARLDAEPTGTDGDDPQAPGRVPPPTRPAGLVAQRTEQDYSTLLPRRTTHGGDFGPAVRAKLVAELRARGL